MPVAHRIARGGAHNDMDVHCECDESSDLVDLAGNPDGVRLLAHMKRTVTTALIVGSILFAINQLDVVLRGTRRSASG